MQEFRMDSMKETCEEFSNESGKEFMKKVREKSEENPKENTEGIPGGTRKIILKGGILRTEFREKSLKKPREKSLKKSREKSLDPCWKS